jgi:hypothetical protein
LKNFGCGVLGREIWQKVLGEEEAMRRISGEQTIVKEGDDVSYVR